MGGREVPRRVPVSSKIGGVDSSSQTAAIGAGRAVQRPQDAAAGGTQSSSNSSGSDENVQITGEIGRAHV